MNLPSVPLMSSDQHLEIYRRLFAENGYPRPIGQLRWLCRERGLPLHGRLALDPEKPHADGLPRAAAIYTTLPARFKLGDEPALALQSLDTMTDHGYRGRGLFLRLAQETYAAAAAAGVPMVYGFPNAASRDGFFGKLGWTSLNPLPFLLRPLRLGYFTRRLGGGALDLPLPRRPRWLRRRGIEIAPVEDFPEDTDLLWSRFAGSFRVGLVRDRAFLEWRYRRKPEHAYRIYAARRGGALQGLAVCRDVEKHGGHIGYLMELLFDPAARGVADALVAAAVDDCAGRRCDAMLAWWFAHSPGYSAHLLNGFVPLPRRLRPVELNFGCRAFDPRYAALLARRRHWHLSYSDSDTV